MKKCPECGNPSYDGAPVCGNCGYKFPKPKVVAPKREDIFQKEPEVKKASKNKEEKPEVKKASKNKEEKPEVKKASKNKEEKPEVKKTSNNEDEDTVSIIKKNKVVIGAILIITLIVICGIVLMGSNNHTSTTNDSTPIIQSDNDLLTYSDGDFSFKYPKSWKEITQNDTEHPGAVFFQNGDKVIIEYYNISNDAKSLKDITQDRISYAQTNGDYVELVETITLDGRNSSNILLENADGDYTRYVSMFSDGELYVFKITGDSENSLSTDDIESTISSADIA